MPDQRLKRVKGEGRRAKNAYNLQLECFEVADETKVPRKFRGMESR
jgi:hypothetical protein